ncbi:hypothetical protein DVS28_b0493 (plasmid) [Euzebya pacifica]|uniref:Uncharacterized protein n=1 Tax=Euzebya pacifica TaxID=1608957 RepID=A0A346Y6Y6_9ACTN|nr:hypothetical protein [Euzebya pacifica]AXV10233.1 hypothetical protein DVS28_b0493 [Euzebya pacifica]
MTRLSFQSVRTVVSRYGLLVLAVVGIVVAALSLRSGGATDEAGVVAEPMPPVETAAPVADPVDLTGGSAGVQGGGTPAEPLVTATLGSWSTDGDILLAAGGTDASGDTAVYTAVCGTAPCAAQETTWVVDGVARTTNPMELRVGTVGVHTVRVRVTGRPAPARTFRAVAVPRSADVPIDGWATGEAVPTDRLRALAYAEEVGWLPPCEVPPGQPRRVCADPAGEIEVVPRQQTAGPLPAAEVSPVPGGEPIPSDQVSEEPQAGSGASEQPVVDDGQPADPLAGVFGNEPVSVSTLTAPDGTEAAVGDCSDRWTPILVRGEFVLGEGLEQGCVARGDLAAGASSAAARPIAVPRCPGRPEPTPILTSDGDDADEPLGPPPCSDESAATVADLYAVAAEVALVDAFGTSCGDVGLPAGCTDAAVAVVAAGGPHEPAVAPPEVPVSRGDVAEVLAWASGNRWLFDPVVSAKPVHVEIDAQAVVAIEMSPPAHWAAVSIDWPDIGGMERDCGPADQDSCSYRPIRSGTHRGDVTISAGPISTTVPVIVTADPPPPELRIGVIQQAPAGSADWVVESDRPVGFWSLTDASGAMSMSASGAGWSVAIVESTSVEARVRVTGTPASDLIVSGCSTGRCGTVALDRGSGQVVAMSDDGQRAPIGDVVLRVTTDGPVDLGERLDGFSPAGSSPLVLIGDPYGTPFEVGEGDVIDGPVVLRVPGWWASGLNGVELVLTGPAGTVTVMATHPEDRR